MASEQQPIGLIAGWGKFPIVFAEKARAMGRSVVCIGLKGEASPDLKDRVDRFYWSSPLRLGYFIRLFKREGVQRAVMAGKVHKGPLLYNPWRLLWGLLDWRTFRAFYFGLRKDNRDDSILLAIINEFNRDGIAMESALDLCPELLAGQGLLTRRAPGAREEADIDFGWDIARKMGELDIGQSVIVKDKSTIAVEAIEGTDQAIERAGNLCRAGGFVVVKVAKPNQDMRFDVPTIGTSTIETIHRAGGKVLAVEAGKTIVLEQEETVALANRYGITIVAR